MAGSELHRNLCSRVSCHPRDMSLNWYFCLLSGYFFLSTFDINISNCLANISVFSEFRS